MQKELEKTIDELIHRQDTAYLSYLDGEGYPVVKAMLMPREREGVRVFYFSTNTSSNKVARFRENPKASVYYSDRRTFQGVSLMGKVEVLETPELKEWIWRDGDTIYYPLGVTDPDYCVLKFTAEKGRCFCNHSVEFTLD